MFNFGIDLQADNSPHIFSYEKRGGQFAYGPDLPDGTLHPLRVLGMTTACDNWQSYNHDGIDEHGSPDPELEVSVCGLIDILPTAYQDSFMVFDYGAYPPLTFIDRSKAHEKAFHWMVSRVENE